MKSIKKIIAIIGIITALSLVMISQAHIVPIEVQPEPYPFAYEGIIGTCDSYGEIGNMSFLKIDQTLVGNLTYQGTNYPFVITLQPKPLYHIRLGLLNGTLGNQNITGIYDFVGDNMIHALGTINWGDIDLWYSCDLKQL